MRDVLIALLALVFMTGVRGEVDEYQVKAAYLFNFAKFVDWPANAFSKADEPMGICVFGQSPLRYSLEEAVRGKTVANRAFAIREISNGQQASKCHILFVAASEGKRSRALLEEIKGSSLLTVGETEDFAAHGGMITFKLQEGRVRFAINAAVAERANLRVSSKLLNLAEIVTNQRPHQ